MTAILAAMLMALLPHDTGHLSAYDETPTVATLEYRQERGQLGDVDGLALLAVYDCRRIGQRALLIHNGHYYHAVVFDCAGVADGGAAWMQELGVVAEVGWPLGDTLAWTGEAVVVYLE